MYFDVFGPKFNGKQYNSRPPFASYTRICSHALSHNENAKKT